RVAKLDTDFVYGTLGFAPISATAAGLHQYQNQNLDRLLDDIGPQGLDRQRRFYQDFRQRLSTEVDPERLSAEDRADYQILGDQISLALLDLQEIQSYLHNPTQYVEAVGNALFDLFVRDYAPLPQRMDAIIARLERLPVYLDQAKLNLVSSPPVWTQVA